MKEEGKEGKKTCMYHSYEENVADRQIRSQISKATNTWMNYVSWLSKPTL